MNWAIIATHIRAFEGDSKVVWFEGNYSEYGNMKVSVNYEVGGSAFEPADFASRAGNFGDILDVYPESVTRCC
jgi:hypothetical protein